ncbi:hypothetical protein A3A54_01180 [Candidatus Curtissbacteria bacterium RIFCSPLOWO2_01_FULL_39_62]|uniref:Gfo/Idh/MocA-like oxidoreductase N-terminal domain-containing protein n=1 Tax=Candidatus Curtissbacteria bacterium RIFCSPLOWO2_12_FULL_38_9 TaxID=1797735 RepID=A0A1F5IAL3_9BACT|nr:MAG: hypothetical protein A3A54_01180 [Candidatus Curtissbacteria bacterium RIFCSPLOWO2_01_FULL_39_62]OGE13447.1 MAG: hypothetical protein A3G14_05365 [Candidatus Curtissbacteria bacterium RIFCSPLOWO2_12_FULL_38_9]
MKDKKIIVVGCGSIGSRHLKNLCSLGVKKLIAVDLDKERLKSLEKIIKDLKTYTNLDSALEKETYINAGFVCTPTSLHIPVATKLAKAKINLFIEKPLSHNLKGVDNLQKVVKRNKLITMMGMNYRFHPGLLKVKKLIDNNKIGQVLSVRVIGGYYLPYWHPNVDYKKEYVARKELGGGVILTSLSHTIDYITWIFGNINLIYAWKGTIGNLKINVEDVAILILKTKMNKPILVYSDFLQKNNQHDFEIVGEKGTIKFNFLSDCVDVYFDEDKNWQKLKYKFEINDMYVREAKLFLSNVKKNQNTEMNINEGIEVLNILLQSKNKLI